MKRILVTGGLGFIGSHLVEKLLEDADTSVCVVDDLSGSPIPVSELTVQLQANRPGRLDVHCVSIEKFASEENFAVIYHLASVVGPAAVLSKAGAITNAIVRSSSRAIELAMRSNARLVNVSTSEVYGGGLNGYCREDSARVIRGKASARQEYAAAKLAMEVSIENLCAAGKLNAVTIRPFNVSGVRQSGRGGFVLPRFIGQAVLNQPLTVFGDGTQIRAFTDVRDIVAGMLLCARSGGCGTTYNVGNPDNRISIDHLADQVLVVTDSSAGKEYVDPRTIYGPSYVEAPDKYPDSSRVMELGWRPNFRLVDTIRDTFEYMSHLPDERLVSMAGLNAGRKLSGAQIAVA